MLEVKDEELKSIVGGSVTGTLINALNSLIKTIYSFGQNFGGAARRIVTNKTCSCSR